MIFAQVCGNVVSTIGHPSLEKHKLLVVDRLHPDGSPMGDYLIAVDAIGAGAGETVLILDEGSGARQILGDAGMPVRSVIVGIVDDVVIA